MCAYISIVHEYTYLPPSLRHTSLIYVHQLMNKHILLDYSQAYPAHASLVLFIRYVIISNSGPSTHFLFGVTTVAACQIWHHSICRHIIGELSKRLKLCCQNFQQATEHRLNMLLVATVTYVSDSV